MTKPVFITIFLLLVLNTYSQFNIITYTGYTFSTNPVMLDNVAVKDFKLNATNSLIKYRPKGQFNRRDINNRFVFLQ